MDGALPACSARLPESDYLCVTNTHRGQEGRRMCVRADVASLKAKPASAAERRPSLK